MLIYEHYKDKPKDFVTGFMLLRLNKALDLQIKGEGEHLSDIPEIN